jgi:hypothetical protein
MRWGAELRGLEHATADTPGATAHGHGMEHMVPATGPAGIPDHHGQGECQCIDRACVLIAPALASPAWIRILLLPAPAAGENPKAAMPAVVRLDRLLPFAQGPPPRPA